MANRPFRVGVLSTLVCDVIHGPPPAGEVSEGWGGVAYGLSGLGAALDEGWEIVPFIKVGRDVASEAQRWVASVPGVRREAALAVVAEPNNRSELRYLTAEQRTERMSGGVPGWTFDELRPLLEAEDADALYVNFLSGREVDLGTMQRIRAHVAGPIYVDLHMLLWETDEAGHRSLRPLRDALAWCACFDFIQVNEDEMRMLATTPDGFAALALRAGALATFVTLGSRGVRYDAHPALRTLEDRSVIVRHQHDAGAQHAGARHAAAPQVAGPPAVYGTLRPPPLRDGARVDPTGCGDVWGGAVFARLLSGDSLLRAMAVANDLASHNAESQGVHGLAERLRARLAGAAVADGAP